MNRWAKWLGWAMLVLLLRPHLAIGQLVRDPLDAKAERQHRQGETKVAVLARLLTAGSDSQAGKVEAIYDWVTHHIRYDARAERRGLLRDTDPATTLRRHRGNSLAIALLFEALCREAGIPVVTIPGHVKRIDYRLGTRHGRGREAWNAVQLGGTWQLVDATWGGTTVRFRPQRQRERRWRDKEIPYLARIQFIHHPDRAWLFVPPDSMLLTHLPIDPRWQLLPFAQPLAAWEAVHDTFLASIPVGGPPPPPSVADLPQYLLQQGEQARLANPTDAYDLAHGHVACGLQALAATPELGGDTLTWQRGVAEFAEARTLLVEWKRTVGREHRTRLLELRRLERVAGRALMLTHGEFKLVKADLQRIDRTTSLAKQLVGDDRSRILEMERRLKSTLPSPDETPKPMKDELKTRLDEQIAAALERAHIQNDSLLAHCKSLHNLISRAYIIGDTIERLRQAISQRLSANAPILMRLDELPYRWASDSLGVASSATRHTRQRRNRATGLFWAAWRANVGRSSKVIRQFEAASKVVETMYAKGLPLDSALARQLDLRLRFRFWVEKREIQLNIPLMEMDLEVSHANMCGEIFKDLDKKIGWQSAMLQTYLKRERHKQMLDFRREMGLARHLDRHAQRGTATMRLWISEARKRARQAN